MTEKFLGGYTEITVLLEAVIEEVFDYRRSAFRDGRVVILDDTKEGGHGFKEMIGWSALQQFDDHTSNAPKEDINEARNRR